MNKPKFWLHVATVGPLGLVKKAPGTVGSIPGIFLGAGLHYLYLANNQSPFVLVSLLLFFLAFTAFSLYSISRAENQWLSHDDKSIVIDEVVGQACVSAVVPLEFSWLVVSFLLFRLLDIWKPWPISYFDQHVPGAWGTLLDDVVAGVIAAVILVFIVGAIK